MIQKYESGRLIQINGEIFQGDVKIIEDKVIGNWWRKQGHRLDTEDIKDITASRPEVLVIGTGYSGMMKVPPETQSALSAMGIHIEAQTTAQAVETFNRLRQEGRKVAGAFHLTC